MLGMLRDFGAFLINYLFNVFISQFSFSPSSFIIINRYRNGILLPSPMGRGKQPKGLRGGGAFLFRLHIPRRVFIRRLIALCHHSDERHDEAEEARHEVYPPCQVDAVRIG